MDVRKFRGLRLTVMLGFWLCWSVTASAQTVNGVAMPRWSSIAFEMHSWGNLLSSWVIDDDGIGRWTGLNTPGEAPRDPATLPTHALDIGSGQFRELDMQLQKLPEPAPNFEPCYNFVTDQPYGIIRLTRGVTTTEIAWNAGCMDSEYLRFLTTLKAANDTVSAWGRKGKIVPK